jgi:hypothetical protein
VPDLLARVGLDPSPPSSQLLVLGWTPSPLPSPIPPPRAIIMTDICNPADFSGQTVVASAMETTRFRLGTEPRVYPHRLTNVLPIDLTLLRRYNTAVDKDGATPIVGLLRQVLDRIPLTKPARAGRLAPIRITLRPRKEDETVERYYAFICQRLYYDVFCVIDDAEGVQEVLEPNGRYTLVIYPTSLIA